MSTCRLLCHARFLEGQGWLVGVGGGRGVLLMGLGFLG